MHRVYGSQGIKCKVDGKLVLIGNRQLMINNQKVITDELNQIMVGNEDSAKTVMILAVDNLVVGTIAVADAIKPEATAAIAALKRMNIEDVWIVSGDNFRVAKAVGQQVKKNI